MVQNFVEEMAVKKPEKREKILGFHVANVIQSLSALEHFDSLNTGWLE